MSSREVDSLIAYVKSVNSDVVVTATVGHFVSNSDPCSPHSPNSNHCADGTGGKGLAVDWGGTEKQIMNAYNALKLVANKLSELIHNAPGITQAVKDGRWVNGLSFYGPTTWDAHKNHCHSSVPKGVFLVPVGPAPVPVPVPVPIGFQVPASYKTEVPQVPFTVSRSQGGYIVVGGDGGVFTYDADFHGSLGGVALTSPIVSGAWTPSGGGYWLMAADGAIFAFGDAVFKGGFNALTPAQKGNRKPIGIVAKGNGYRIVTLDPSNDGSPFDSYEFGV